MLACVFSTATVDVQLAPLHWLYLPMPKKTQADLKTIQTTTVMQPFLLYPMLRPFAFYPMPMPTYCHCTSSSSHEPHEFAGVDPAEL